LFDALTDRLSKVFERLRSGGRVTEADLEAALREVRLALLEADVAFKVVRDFLTRVKDKALGEKVLDSLTPGQQVIRVVRDELTELLGGAAAVRPLATSPKIPTVYMLCGLQGSGKTTTCGKLGLWLKKQGRHPLIAPVDLARPAAVLQAIQVAKSSGLAAYEHDASGTPVQRAQEAVRFARERGFDVVLLDTAGRLHVDEDLMQELAALDAAVHPVERLYVADAMTGQDAVRSAEAFRQRVALTGVILSKLDGDARGGAALSIAAVTGVPVRFAGVSEKPDGLELFDPNRMAGRILGMGDVLGLIEKAEVAFDADEAEKLQKALRRNQFSLENFRDTLRQMRKLGPLESLMGMIPGLRLPVNAEVDPKAVGRMEAIINSMTPRERRDHRVIDGSRRKRIAKGSGTSVQDVNRLLKQYMEMHKMMKALGGGMPDKGKLRRLLGGMR
jgi:signal recognition particle subunit SRP54